MARERGPGRNDPCPCGSGRKFKHCCLGTAGERLEHRRLAVEQRDLAFLESLHQEIPDGPADFMPLE